MFKKTGQFIALEWQDKKTVAAALALLPLFWIGLRLGGLARAKAWVERGRAPARADRSVQQLAARGRLVNIAAFYSPGSVTCLTRSLLLHWMFRREGIASELRIGVRMAAGELDAHAWVEYADLPVNDVPDVASRYHRLF